jgi:hypothetical protein
VTPEIDRADPSARRASLTLIVCGAVAGLAVLVAFARYWPAIRAWVAADPPRRVRILLAVLIAATSGPVVAFSVYVWRLGARIVRAQRYPPPGLRLTRDVEVKSGEAAVRHGRLVQLCAYVLGAATLGFGVVLWRVAETLGRR